jgi:hypothetical protein
VECEGPRRVYVEGSRLDTGSVALVRIFARILTRQVEDTRDLEWSWRVKILAQSNETAIMHHTDLLYIYMEIVYAFARVVIHRKDT